MQYCIVEDPEDCPSPTLTTTCVCAWRKAPQSKWSLFDRPNVQNLSVQMDGGPMDRLCYVDLDRPNGRRSNGPPILRLFGPSKWTAVQWTTYVTLIWPVQMDGGPINHLYYINLDPPNGRRSNGPPMLLGPSKLT